MYKAEITRYNENDEGEHVADLIFEEPAEENLVFFTKDEDIKNDLNNILTDDIAFVTSRQHKLGFNITVNILAHPNTADHFIAFKNELASYDEYYIHYSQDCQSLYEKEN